LSGKIDPDQMTPLFSVQLIKVRTWEQKMKSRHTGFTLIELVITIALLGILLAWAIPNVTIFIQNARMASAVNELVGDLGVARQEAQRRGRSVTICASSDGLNCQTSTPNWMDGWIIRAPTATGTQIVKYNKDPEGPSSTRKVYDIGSTTTSIIYSPSGSTLAGAVIRLRDDRAGQSDPTQRDITINLVGRPAVGKVTG
jgi:prepilin-type N-terminal cleavage/methylation domain-containing protein